MSGCPEPEGGVTAMERGCGADLYGLTPVAYYHMFSPARFWYNAIQGSLRGRTGRIACMLEPRDFATGCLTILLCVILVPLFFLVFKLTLFFAILLAIVTGMILGITIVGRIVRLFITGK
jgi:hypothetical protein